MSVKVKVEIEIDADGSMSFTQLDERGYVRTPRREAAFRHGAGSVMREINSRGERATGFGPDDIVAVLRWLASGEQRP